MAVLVSAGYLAVNLRAGERTLGVALKLKNNSRRTWKKESFFIGWQYFDPETNRFIQEGQWTPIPADVAPGETLDTQLTLNFPPETGGYRIYISPLEQPAGWAYTRGDRFLIIDARIANRALVVSGHELTNTRVLRLRSLRRALPKIFSYPFQTIATNQRLIRSMARRDVLARYRGSFGDVLWTILNPLLLMATYFFVFGVVLHARFGQDQSSTGFALYFLAGMLPWLAFSEPVGRAPQVILEHRNFVKKLIFPLEILPVNQVVSGFITEAFALGVFTIGLLIIRHTLPVTILWLPLLVIPQLLFTLGVCWFLAGLGAFLRDLGQIMGFVLTLWFFITPICYSYADSHMPKAAFTILRKNPLYVLVEGYRAVFLEHAAPEALPLIKLWILAVVVFLAGHAWFHKLRKLFADVI